MTEYVLALDQGTTSSKAFLFDEQGRIVSQAGKDTKQIYPRPGWVEHDPMEIWESQLDAAREAIVNSGIEARQIAAIGITNQRETTVVWDKRTGKPVYNAIVWQCRRTAERCSDLLRQGFDDRVRSRTGLVVDAYFSGTKVEWILNNVPGARDAADRGDLLFGTIDTWLIWNLTGGRVHATDYSNASRTLLYDIRALRWDDEILSELSIPRSMLPEVRPSGGLFGVTQQRLFGKEIPIAGVAGDQQAALFGQCCFSHGTAKTTYGTGSFILMNTGETAVSSSRGLLTTIAWGIGDRVCYALEGSNFIAGAAIQWLRDELGIIKTAAESETLARQVDGTGGVFLVPAFVGLGAPYWDMYARGTIVGMTRGTNRCHIARAALEAIAFQVSDTVGAMLADTQGDLRRLRVDGGAVENDFLMQFQADILGKAISRPVVFETTALGAAYLAGLGVGLYTSLEDIEALWRPGKRFEPHMTREQAEKLTRGWARAVERAKGWAL